MCSQLLISRYNSSSTVHVGILEPIHLLDLHSIPFRWEKIDIGNIAKSFPPPRHSLNGHILPLIQDLGH